jgi:3-methyladenine DNA glycosylase Tag
MRNKEKIEDLEAIIRNAQKEIEEFIKEEIDFSEFVEGYGSGLVIK